MKLVQIIITILALSNCQSGKNIIELPDRILITTGSRISSNDSCMVENKRYIRKITRRINCPKTSNRSKWRPIYNLEFQYADSTIGVITNHKKFRIQGNKYSSLRNQDRLLKRIIRKQNKQKK